MAESLEQGGGVTSRLRAALVDLRAGERAEANPDAQMSRVATDLRDEEDQGAPGPAMAP